MFRCFLESIFRIQITSENDPAGDGRKVFNGIPTSYRRIMVSILAKEGIAVTLRFNHSVNGALDRHVQAPNQRSLAQYRRNTRWMT
ncbi:hypothetical protein [Iodidimonas sp. SYSU 1G8]|jgi:hypothetical protein|uniref:hypothetical protein n=1 Tax=Iodidimonas sp. SYSU 1G8 TaxID=3133967 RepID=UPI0031FEC7D8